MTPEQLTEVRDILRGQHADLQTEIERLHAALVAAAIPLGALASQRTGWHSPEMERSIREAATAVRRALETW